VSLTALDQTPFEALDENNAFNAVGMRKLAEVIATSKKERAEIDARPMSPCAAPRWRPRSSSCRSSSDEEEARIAQVPRRSRCCGPPSRPRSRAAARIPNPSRNAPGSSARKKSAAAEIARARAIEAAEITKEREIEVANQERQIVIAQKSEEESRARASADTCPGRGDQGAEAIETARAVAEAERAKQIALIEAAREAERKATKLRLAAQAEKDAANDRAAARREEAQRRGRCGLDPRRGEEAGHAGRGRRPPRAWPRPRTRCPQRSWRCGSTWPGSRRCRGSWPRWSSRWKRSIRSRSTRSPGGLGGTPAAATGRPTGDKPVVNQALDSIMGMAVQLPTMKKLGEELGLSLEGGLGSITGSEKPATGGAPAPVAPRPDGTV
jgi:flotillin